MSELIVVAYVYTLPPVLVTCERQTGSDEF